MNRVIVSASVSIVGILLLKVIYRSIRLNDTGSTKTLFNALSHNETNRNSMSSDDSDHNLRFNESETNRISDFREPSSDGSYDSRSSLTNSSVSSNSRSRTNSSDGDRWGYLLAGSKSRYGKNRKTKRIGILSRKK
jgi:hypothetical protein